MGNKANASAALREEDIQVLFEKDLLGSFTAEALLNTLWFNNIIHFGLLCRKEHREMCWGDVKLWQNFHGAGVPRIQQKRNQNSFKKRSTECNSHCTENVCCAEQPEMSSKSLQSLRRKATRGNGNQRCTVSFDSTQCKIWQQRRTANWYYATVRSQKLFKVSLGTLTSPRNNSWIWVTLSLDEFERNSSPVWLFYSGEKKVWVWRTQLSNISSDFFSLASSTAAPFSFLDCCYKRRTYRCGNKHFKSIAHTFSVRGKP